MDVRSTLNQCIALTLAGILLLDPIVVAAAQLTVDAAAGNNTSIGQSSNGVPIVNIATPNGGGLSHNKFQDYNVGQQGLILNNAQGQSNSVLGGAIQGNANLQGRAANAILNEVTGSSRSRLAGYTEVAGQAARVIVANPHGITCDGCGFINTPRATLTTGTPIIEGDRLSRYWVEGGDIAIEGLGLNASNLDQFELITRSAKLNAELYAKKLEIVTGRNDVDAQTLSAKVLPPSDDQPLLALDSSALGGMYANTIRLVGTEKGVGVNMAGDMAASAGDIRIDASGKLTLAQTAASGDIQLTAPDIELTGKTYAGKRVSATSSGTLSNRQSIAAKDGINLKATAIINPGIIEAGVELNNSRNNSGDVTIETGALTNSGTVIASRALNARAAQLNNAGGTLYGAATAIDGASIDNSRGMIIGLDTLALNGITTLNNDAGLIASEKDLTLDGGRLSNRRGEISASTVAIASASLDNQSGQVLADELELHLQDTLNNSAGTLIGRQMQTVQAAELNNANDGLIASNGNLLLNLNRLQNTGGGTLSSGGALSLMAQRVNNHRGGQIAASGNLNVSAEQFYQQGGLLLSEGTLTLKADRLGNSDQGLIAANKAIDLTVSSIENSGGEISSAGQVHIRSTILNNSHGTLIGGKLLRLNVISLLNHNQGTLASGGQLLIKGEGLNNSGGGLLSSQSALDIDLNQKLDNRHGALISEGALNLKASGLDNTGGTVSSAGQTQLNVRKSVNNSQGVVVTDGALSITTANLDNRQGTLSSRGALSLTAAIQNNQGSIVSGADLLLRGERIDNTGGTLAAQGDIHGDLNALTQGQGSELISHSRLNLNLSGGDLTNHGLIQAKELHLGQLGHLDNSGGELAIQNGFVINAASVDNRGGQILTNGQLQLSVQQTLDNSLKGLLSGVNGLTLQATKVDNSGQGVITSRGDLLLRTIGTLNNRRQGTVVAGRSLTIDSGELDNSEEGLIAAEDAIALQTGELNNDGGQLIGQNILTLNAAGLSNRQGVISARRDLHIDTAAIDNRQGLLISADRLTLQGTALNNSAGEISAENGLDLRVQSLIQNQGQLLSGSDLRLDLQGGRLDNTQGTIHSEGALLLQNAGHLSNHHGDISSQQNIALDARQLDNRTGRIIGGQQLSITATDIDNSQSGLLSGWGGVDLQGVALNNSQRGTVSSKNGELKIHLSGRLDNSGEGALVSQSGQYIKARDLNNASGLLSSGGIMSLNTERLNNEYGQLISQKGLTLTASESLRNHKGQITSNGNLLLSGGQIDNQGGSLTSQGRLTLKAVSLDNSQRGTLAASTDLDLNLSGDLRNAEDGLLYARDTLSLSARTLYNGGGTIQSQGSATLNVKDKIGNLGGRIDSFGGDLTIRAANIDNQQGILATAQGVVDLSARHLDNRSGIVQGRDLKLTADELTNRRGGYLSAVGGDAVLNVGNLNNRDGELYASGQLLLQGDWLSNQSGRIGADHIRIDQSQSVDNSGGLIESTGTLTIRAQQALYNREGALRSLGSEGESQLSAWHLDNTSGVIEIANRDLTLQAQQLANENGDILHLGEGLFRLDTSLSERIGGRLIGLGGLALQADQWVNSSVLQAKDLQLNVNRFEQTDSGGLIATGTLSGTGQQWINNGLLFAGEHMELQIGDLTNRGDILSLGSLSISGGLLENRSATIESAGDMHLNVERLLNTKDVFELDQRLVSGFIAMRCIDCGGDDVNTDYTIREEYLSEIKTDSPMAFIHSGGDLRIQGGQIDNRYSSLSASGDIAIQSGRFNNEGATLGEAVRTRTYNTGWIGYHELELGASQAKQYNQTHNADPYTFYYYNDSAEGLRRGYVEESNGWYINKDTLTGQMIGGTYYIPAFTSYRYDPDNLGDMPTFYEGYNKLRDTWEYTPSGAAANAVVQAGGNIAIEASESLDNSVISPFINSQGQLTDARIDQYAQSVVAVLNPQLPPDLSQQYLNPLEQPGFTLPSDSALFRINSDQGDQGARSTTWQGTGDWSVDLSLNGNRIQTGPTLAAGDHQGQGVSINGGPLPGSQLGGIRNNIDRVYGLPSSQVKNGSHPYQPATGGNSTGTGSAISGQPGAGTGPTGTGTPGMGAIGTGVAGTNPIGTGTTGTTTPGTGATGTGTLGQGGTSPSGTNMSGNSGSGIFPGQTGNGGYLVETNPVIGSGALSSDYLLRQLGADPATAQKRLGDGFYEQRLIREAIVQRTGQRFIDGLSSDQAMYRHLMDNAIAASQSLQLSVGIGLSAAQVNALTQDIVWLEEHEVNGQRVLVPVVYLAQANNRQAPTGALIAGQNVQLTSQGELNNSGTVRAAQDLSAQAQNINNRGLIEAGNRLEMRAEERIRNHGGGIISGRDVSLSAQDILNERTVTVDHRGDERNQQRTVIVDSASRIEAVNDLLLQASRDLTNTGSELRAGQDLLISAGRDLRIDSAQGGHDGTRSDGKHYNHDSLIEQYGSRLTAGRDIDLSANRDLSVIASGLSAERDVALSAGQDLLLSSAANESHFEFSKKHQAEQKDQIRQQASTIDARGNVSLIAGNDLAIIASQIDAGADAQLIAGNNLGMLSAQDYDHFYYEKTKKGSWGNKSFKRDEVTDIKHIGSDISAGGDLLIVSGSDQHYQAARLKSDNDLILVSGGKMTFEGVKDYHQESHEKSQSDLAWQKAKGKGSIHESLIQSELVAQGQLAIQAAEGLQIDLRDINQQTVSQTIEAMVKANPDLVWLKEAEQRGDVNWRLVKEVHDSWSYSQQGVSPVVAMAVAIVAAVVTAGAASGAIGAAAGATAGSGTAMAAAGMSATGQMVAAGWANATLSGVAAGFASGTVGSLSQGKDDWLEDGVRGGVTGGFAGYLSAGTYFNNPLNEVSKFTKYAGNAEWGNLAKQMGNLGMNQAWGYAQGKLAKEMGLTPEELNWILMAGSIVGNQLSSVGTRFQPGMEFEKTNEIGIKGVGNRKKPILGLPFDVIDIMLGYQGLPDATVQDYLTINGVESSAAMSHSLGTLTGKYLATNGLIEKIYMYSLPLGNVAPGNSEVMIGSGDLVNGGWSGKLFNWDAEIVLLKPWEHGFENYKKYIED